MTIQELINEYLSFNKNDDDKIHKYKRYIKALPLNEQIIILYYIQYGSYREAAKELNISPSTVFIKLKKIKNKIKRHCDDN